MKKEKIAVAVVGALALAFVVALGTGLIRMPAERCRKLLEIVPAGVRLASVISVSEYEELARSMGADQRLFGELPKAEYVVFFVTDRYVVLLEVGGAVSDVVEEMGAPESVEEYRGYKIYRYRQEFPEDVHTVAEGKDVVIAVVGNANMRRIIDIVEDGPYKRFVDEPYAREALDAVDGSLMVAMIDLSMPGKTAVAAVGAERVGNKVRVKIAICGDYPDTFPEPLQGAQVQRRGPCVVSEKEMNFPEFAMTAGSLLPP